MKKWFFVPIAFVVAQMVALANHASSSSVKITPLGSHDGEFCRFDRALIFEDPNGTRLIYDVGRTVAGVEDKRLGDIDAVLLSHVHGDHLGDRYISEVNAGECGEPDVSQNATPNSNTVDIALAKDAQIVVGSEMNSFLANKVEVNGGNPESVQLVRFGASVEIDGVKITTVPAVHSNGLSSEFIEGELGDDLKAAGLTAYVGPPTGYVLTFTNGLVVYLSGDTGVTAEQETVVRNQYSASVMVINIGDTFTTGPTEAAYVVNELVKPQSVIASHANEAATEEGKIIPGTKTDEFIKATEIPVYIPLSGQTIEFDGSGGCVAGC
ncbi:putative Zn-dependent hydrolases of the beta-lactamase fold [Hyella patelloides LEGE 07179]|uniref:Putative Zn-dependent hydrolases of the beta-lactamase fold n=1 Tax=Hyella patelloides LEGE 07179 TaxID=945734 RepID=A0A563VPC2_9CYAN|nr:MBL fold metallo-hydrolase [Hyella patelloides]VEP13306.1 putative Zn-dependent hydrolases of the beta-lactamase fold [Hyella patelloides LEGE 07179]